MLAQIHLVDYDAVGLGEFGHPDGFLERQVRRWGEQWERSKTRELPGGRRARPPAQRRAAGVAARPRSSTATTGSTTRCWPPTTRARSSRSSTGRCRRSAIRSPTSACSSSTGATRARRSSRPDAAIDAKAGFLTSRRDRRALRAAERPTRRRARLVRGVRLLQARDHRRGHPRPVPDGQDARRGLRRDGRDGRRAHQRRDGHRPTGRRSRRCGAR